MPGRSLKEQFPLRLIIGSDDLTVLLDEGATWSATDPGGFEAASFQFPKDLPQLIRGQYVRLDSGLGVAWEGRVSQVQRSLGNRTTINCEGYGALLKDEAASMVFVDRDLTRWGQPSVSRQIALVSANKGLGTSQVQADTTNGSPALAQVISGAWVSPNLPLVESWYDAGPANLISQIYYSTNPSVSLGAGWEAFVLLCSNDVAAAFEQSGNVANTTTGYFAPGTPYRYGLLQFEYVAGAGGSDGAQVSENWHNLAAYGNHGLPGRGTDPVGFYPSDIFGWIVSQIPGLQPGVIQQTDESNFILPHSVYYTPVNLDQIAGDMATAQGWHWGVWESLSPLTGDPRPRADFRPRPASGEFTAFCHRDACDTLDIREDLGQQFNIAVVNFSDVAGVQQSVTVTADNPILDEAGIASRALVLNGGTMTPATAAVFGGEALAITNIQARVAGSADIVSPIDGPSGPMAPWMLRPGIDRLRIGDAPSTDAFGQMSDYPITRVESSISSSGITVSVELGSGANLVETLNARLAAATALAGNGGG
jgi:hypothetical protein